MNDTKDFSAKDFTDEEWRALLSENEEKNAGMIDAIDDGFEPRESMEREVEYVW